MQLLDFAQELVQNGFRVWYSPDMPTYLVAAFEGHLGYVQESLGVGYRYSTMHRPSSTCGTGFQYADGALCVDIMWQCCMTFVPEWWRGDTTGIHKWTIDQWLKKTPYVVEILPHSEEAPCPSTSDTAERS